MQIAVPCVRGVPARPSEDVVGGDAALPIGRAGQRDECRDLAHEVRDLDRVPDGPDRRIAGAHVGVHLDAAGAAEREARVSRELRLGTDADGEKHETARYPGAVRELCLEAMGLAVDRFHRDAQTQVDTIPAQLVVERRHHLRVRDGHHVGQALDEHDPRSAIDERLRHLEADVPTSDHERRERPGALHDLDDPVHVLQVAQREDSRVVHAGQGWADGLGTRAEHEGIVGLSVLAAALRSRTTTSFASRSIRSTSVFTRTSRPNRARRLSGV